MNNNHLNNYYIVKSITYIALLYTNNSFKYAMKNWFNNKQNLFYAMSSITGLIENTKTQSNSEKYEYNNIIDYPYAKEWETIVFSYNKYFKMSLICYNTVLNKLVKSYSNMLEYKPKIQFKIRRANKIRYSSNKLYTSRAELNHTNTTIFITLYLYNKPKSSIIRYIVDVITYIKSKSEFKNRLVHFLKDNFFIFKKWNMPSFKTVDNAVRHSLFDFKIGYLSFYNIPVYRIILLKKFIRLQETHFDYTKDINSTLFKFNTLYLKLRNLGLMGLIEKLYNKKVLFNVIELKSIHLNSDVFSSAVALKLRDRKNKAVRILRKAILQMVKIPDLHTLRTFDDNIEEMNKNNIIKTIKQQIVSGVRFEASGRLTRRLTAMRAVFKYRYAGSLKNIRTSFNNKSSTMLRGYVKSNSQYTLINSKTRNGTFGLKGWVSSHNLMVQLDLSQFVHLPQSIDYTILACILISLVILGLIFKSVWNNRVLTVVEEIKPAPVAAEKRPCTHPIMTRRALAGDHDFQQWNTHRCAGHQHVIPTREGNGGTICTTCGNKFCNTYGCICKSRRN